MVLMRGCPYRHALAKFMFKVDKRAEDKEDPQVDDALVSASDIDFPAPIQARHFRNAG